MCGGNIAPGAESGCFREYCAGRRAQKVRFTPRVQGGVRAKFRWSAKEVGWSTGSGLLLIF